MHAGIYRFWTEDVKMTREYNGVVKGTEAAKMAQSLQKLNLKGQDLGQEDLHASSSIHQTWMNLSSNALSIKISTKTLETSLDTSSETSLMELFDDPKSRYPSSPRR